MASFKALRFCLLVVIFVGVSMAEESASEEAVESRAYPAPKKPNKFLNKNKKPSVIAPGYRPVASAYGAPTPAAYPTPAPAPAYPTPAAYSAPAYPTPAPYQAPAYPAPPAAAYKPNPTPVYKKPAPVYPSQAPAYPSAQYPLESENKPYASYKPVDGRVKMQAYRGPNKDYEKEDSFAPWGYFINQPAEY